MSDAPGSITVWRAEEEIQLGQVAELIGSGSECTAFWAISRFFEALFAVNFFRFRTTATIILLSKHMTLLKITVTSLLSLIFDLFSNLSNSPHSHANFKVL